MIIKLLLHEDFKM